MIRSTTVQRLFCTCDTVRRRNKRNKKTKTLTTLSISQQDQACAKPPASRGDEAAGQRDTSPRRPAPLAGRGPRGRGLAPGRRCCRSPPAARWRAAAAPGTASRRSACGARPAPFPARARRPQGARERLAAELERRRAGAAAAGLGRLVGRKGAVGPLVAAHLAGSTLCNDAHDRF